MEISQIGAGGLLGASTNQPATTPSRAVTPGMPVGNDTTVRPSLATSEPRSQALSILRQEIRQALQANFRVSFVASAPGYADTTGVNADDVAADALNGAAAAANRSPLEASRILVDLRERVEVKAQEVREIVGDDDDDDYDDALSRISGGLDDLEDDAARNTESSASVLSAESKLKQRSTIRIRTQEGDIVRFDLRRIEKMSAEDVSVRNGEMSFSSTEVAMSSRSRMTLRVSGDLNKAEYAAIQNVFAQAEVIADEFFGGDLAAAFDMASGIEFDSEQLARVNMRFREKLESEVSYAAIGPVLSRPDSIPTPVVDPAPAFEPAQPAEATVVATPDVDLTEVAQPVVDSGDAVAEPSAPPLADNALEGFFDLLSSFLSAATEGFEPGGGESSYRFFYTQSFNLEILRSVLEFKAPDEAAGAADTAAAIIDGIVETGDDD